MSELKDPREINDIGKVLYALFQESDSTQDYSTITWKYIKKKQSVFKASVERSQSIRIDNLPNLRLHRGDRILVGGSAIVVQCRNSEIQSINYALKVTRPSDLGEISEIESSIEEYLKHGPLSHVNIARVFAWGKISIDHRDAPVFLMEWIEEPLPICSHIIERCRSPLDVIDILFQSFRALSYLHDANLIHWDMKSDNLLVNGKSIVKLTDIGNARSSDQTERNLEAKSTIYNLPPLLKPEYTPESCKNSPRRIPIDLPDHSWDCAWLDMWMLARELNRLILADENTLSLDDEEYFESFTRSDSYTLLRRLFPEDDNNATHILECIRIILRRLLLPKEPSDDLFYESAKEVELDLRKIVPEFGAAQNIPELRVKPQNVMRLPVTGNLPFTPRIGRLFNSSIVQNLVSHLQLGTVVHVYPGASHRRIEHVVGVMAYTIHYIQALYSDRSDPFWRISVEQHDVNALIVAALLHDVGHVAFGHYLEEMKGLLDGLSHMDMLISTLDLGRAESTWKGWEENSEFAVEVKKEHIKLLELFDRDWLDEGESAKDFAKLIAQILRPTHKLSPISESTSILSKAKSEILKIEILHSIIDSPIDADKLDYLYRDAHHAGLKYTQGIDLERFFQALTTVSYINPHKTTTRAANTNMNLHASIAVTEKGSLPIESILIGRYQMFSSLYWHHTTRAETAMLQYAVQYYLLSNSHISVLKKLEILLERWRVLSDRDAILWLREKLISPERKLSNAKRKTLTRVMKGLQGERQYLYWPIFNLRFPGHFKESKAQKLVKYWLNFSTKLNRIESPSEYIQYNKDRRDFVLAQLNRKLGLGKSLIREGELLLDVPPSGKDQIDNVFVVTKSGIKTIQEITPLATAVQVAFQYWTRSIRIFIAPTAWTRLNKEGVSEKSIANSCWQVLNEIAEDQLSFDFSKDD